MPTCKLYADTTVRVAKKYLEEHPEELKSLTEAMDDVKRVRIGSPIISVFLGWPESRVSYSLERLNLEKSGMVNRQASFLLSLILRWPFQKCSDRHYSNQTDRQGAASSFLSMTEYYYSYPCYPAGKFTFRASLSKSLFFPEFFKLW